MDCKEAQILFVSHIMGDLKPKSLQSLELEAHLRSCQVCAKEYKESKATIEFIQSNKTEFAEAFESIERKETAERQELERSWQAIEVKLDKLEAQQKTAPFFRIIWKATVAAACAIIGISIWLILTNSKTSPEHAPQQLALTSAPSVKIELLSDDGSIIIPADRNITTSTSRLKTLVLNDKHRLIMNEKTKISIQPFRYDKYIGCMVNLSSGQIYANVEHDGNPFIVETTHGKAVITGTTFDVKATGTGTTLIVAEGAVQFASQVGSVEVQAGQTSKIIAQSTPTQPLPCNVEELTAWATGYELKTTLAKIESISDSFDLADHCLTTTSVSVDFETIDYASWIEQKRAWFGREFPHIFQLQSALSEEGLETDYPQLLISSGDLWQFVYPQSSPGRIPIFTFDSMLTATSEFGYDEQWLRENIPVAKSAIDTLSEAEEIYTCQKAFEQWVDCFHQALKSQEVPDSEMLLYSLHAGTYLANTRTLAGLSLINDKLNLPSKDKAEILALLQTEVNTANKLTEHIIRLFAASENQPCGEFDKLMDQVIEEITGIMNIEERILEYEACK